MLSDINRKKKFIWVIISVVRSILKVNLSHNTNVSICFVACVSVLQYRYIIKNPLVF